MQFGDKSHTAWIEQHATIDATFEDARIEEKRLLAARDFYERAIDGDDRHLAELRRELRLIEERIERRIGALQRVYDQIDALETE